MTSFAEPSSAGTQLPPTRSNRIETLTPTIDRGVCSAGRSIRQTVFRSSTSMLDLYPRVEVRHQAHRFHAPNCKLRSDRLGVGLSSLLSSTPSSDRLFTETSEAASRSRSGSTRSTRIDWVWREERRARGIVVELDGIRVLHDTQGF